MTVSPCIPLADLERVATLPPGDPSRRHVADCPRCSALVESYALFVEPGEAAAAPHVAAADARLTAFLAREIGVPALSSAPAPASARPASARREGSWLERLFAPPLRPALAFGAVAIVIAGVALWPRAAGRAPSDALRGDPGAPTVAVREARLDAAGLSVAWSAVAGADDYEVRVYSAELAELARLNANGDTVLTVPPSGLAFRAVPGQPLLLRVFARRGGEAIADSPPLPLVLP